MIINILKQEVGLNSSSSWRNYFYLFYIKPVEVHIGCFTGKVHNYTRSLCTRTLFIFPIESIQTSLNMQIVVDLVWNHLTLPIYLTLQLSLISTTGYWDPKLSTAVFFALLMDLALIKFPRVKFYSQASYSKITAKLKCTYSKARSLPCFPHQN